MHLLTRIDHQTKELVLTATPLIMADLNLNKVSLCFLVNTTRTRKCPEKRSLLIRQMTNNSVKHIFKLILSFMHIKIKIHFWTLEECLFGHYAILNLKK